MAVTKGRRGQVVASEAMEQLVPPEDCWMGLKQIFRRRLNG